MKLSVVCIGWMKRVYKYLLGGVDLLTVMCVRELG